jgi:hypothetical protein
MDNGLKVLLRLFGANLEVVKHLFGRRVNLRYILTLEETWSWLSANDVPLMETLSSTDSCKLALSGPYWCPNSEHYFRAELMLSDRERLYPVRPGYALPVHAEDTALLASI